MRLKLNWFSPIPPSFSAISHYSARILPALTSVADVTVWTIQDAWDAALDELVTVRKWEEAALPWRDLNDAHLNCYQIGNNAEFHSEILRLARTVPGMVVLHDTQLQHLIRGFLPTSHYRRLMFETYGPAGLEGAELIEKGELRIEIAGKRFPLALYAIENALGIVLHSEPPDEMLAASFPTPVRVLQLPYALGVQVESPQRSGPVRLVQFGYLGPNRRIDRIFDALAGMSDKWDFRLDIYGKIWDEALVEKWIAERSLNEVVHLHGFVDETVLDRAIAKAELAINLRWPTMGEASDSQLRIWNANRTALVTNTGWYARLPADAVFFVDIDHEVDDIRRHLRALKVDPVPYWNGGARGREILKSRHDPFAYAQGLVSHAKEILAARVGVGRSVGMRLGTCLSQWPRELTKIIDIAAIASRLASESSVDCR